jgi:hypothetical protein
VISDVTILYDALDGQQLVVLYEDLDQDGLLNEDMPVVYNHSETVVTEGLYMLFLGYVCFYFLKKAALFKTG